MKDMKEMVNTNSQQARQWLVENPQFAYALLQVSFPVGQCVVKKVGSV
jgi:hypothetical protein